MNKLFYNIFFLLSLLVVIPAIPFVLLYYALDSVSEYFDERGFNEKFKQSKP